MTTYFEEDFESLERTPAAMGVLVNWAGALVSLALIAGLAVWGYQLLVRDVTGVPVVRALEGPMRVAPKDPGGLRPEYQELTVTRVASDGAEEAPAEQVVLAPAPLDLADEDRPIAALIEDEPAEAVTTDIAAEEEAPDAIELAIAEALEGSILDETVEQDEAAETEAPAVLLDGAVASSPRPTARPVKVELVRGTTEPVAEAVADAVGGEVAAADIPPGTRLVQLGAFPTAERAREAWSTLEGRFGEYLDGKARVVQEASAGGSSFYRLRAMGFEDLSDARRFCAVLVADNANCIPVIRR